MKRSLILTERTAPGTLVLKLAHAQSARFGVQGSGGARRFPAGGAARRAVSPGNRRRQNAGQQQCEGKRNQSG